MITEEFVAEVTAPMEDIKTNLNLTPTISFALIY